MKRAIVGALLIGGLVWGDEEMRFLAADVHVSPKPMSGQMMQFARTRPVRNGRYEITTANMVDLIRIAYGYGNDKVLGGPSWIEMDRYDVVAKVPPDSTPDTQKEMLKALLAERFKLKVHEEKKARPWGSTRSWTKQG